MEPAWTKKISSTTICNFFYVFFMVYAGIFVLSVLMTVGVLTSTKLKGSLGLALGTQAILTTLIGGTMMLFYYLICDRALLTKPTEKANSLEAFKALMTPASNAQ